MDRVRALIAAGTYGIGDRLPPETELCALFDVGRSTLREAMRVLASRGIVDVRHGEGTFVGARALRETFEERLERAQLADLYEARLALESPLAELAAARRSAPDLASMRKCLRERARAATAGDVNAYAEADFAFHLAVAKAAKSPALFDIYSAFVEVVRAEMADVATPEFVRSENDRLHDALCDAIAAGDARKARRLVRSHLEGSLVQHTARLE